MRVVFFLMSTLLAQNLFAESQLCDAQLYKAKFSDSACPSDHRLAEAIKVQIARRICLANLDPVCLQDISGKMDARSCSKFTLDRNSGAWDANANISCAKDKARAFKGSYSERVFKEWMKPDSAIRLEPYNFDYSQFNSQQRPEGPTAAQLLHAGLSVAPHPLAQTLVGIFTLEELLFSPKAPSSNVSTECGFAAIHMGALRTENNTCLPSYEIQQTAVRTFLNQDPKYIDSALRCKNTCLYYNTMLFQLLALNNFMESTLTPPLQGEPKCNADGSVSFQFTQNDPRVVASAMSLPTDGMTTRAPLNKTTTWTVVAHQKSDALKVSMSPDQVAPGIFQERFDQLHLTYNLKTDRTLAPIAPPASQLTSGKRTRKIALKPRVDSSSKVGEAPHKPIWAGLTLLPRVFNCCKQGSPKNCVQDNYINFEKSGEDATGVNTMAQ